MSGKFAEYKNFNLSEINKEYAQKWVHEKTFQESIRLRKDSPEKPYIFYEGPPSANGMPGIHHVISRTLKDFVCRYKTQKGHMVERKAGWDTHGLPVELSVEKRLGITKEDIGIKIAITDYNQACKEDVMKYTSEWEELTRIMGYWVDMENPYITYDSKYIETLWYLLSELYRKKLLYKGYTIQPYSPAAGTGLSSHELNQPGCYRDVKDTTCVAQFEAIRNSKSEFLFQATDTPVYFLAWTTTPWTLPSNTALAVGSQIRYVLVKTCNPYTAETISVVLAKDLMWAYFNEKNSEIAFEEFTAGGKELPFKIMAEFQGKELEAIQYEQLLNWIRPEGKAFEVLLGDFVTTEDGTGIVHIAPTFGADDYRVAIKNNVVPLLVTDKEGNKGPLVDKKGRFIRLVDIESNFLKQQVNIETYQEFAGRYVKNAYDESLPENAPTVDIDISVHLKQSGKAFKIEKQVHNYPHCWRTDKPVLYYPLDSWFIKTTAVKDRLLALNNTINWKPESTGTGRFGKWLENLVDWNLSRSRYWGTPLPIWRTEDGSEEKCIGSVKELCYEIEKALSAGVMKQHPFKDFKPGDYSSENYSKIDLHRHTVDSIVLISDRGKPMHREDDLIDVWFDSGAMPYAQVHYPFSVSENDFKEKMFPADFIAEGVDQTRGWFFTLHALATMLFDSVSFKNIISNGLVLDKNGNKMSKRLGNAVDPFQTIEKYGSDPLRWYMITNAQPWDNLKFDIEGIEEVRRKFFGTLYNTYSFFALYANVDGFKAQEQEIPVEKRPEIDRWIISLLNTLIKEVDENYANYEPTKAGRAIQDFVNENLSNWYVRLNRKRYWGGEFNQDKLAAYQTLYTCLETIAMLMAPLAPFYSDKLFCDLNAVSKKHKVNSVHLSDFPVFSSNYIDKDLEQRMEMAQEISSMVLGLRRKVSLKVRQPLSKIMVPVLNEHYGKQLRNVAELILSEVNVKEIEYLTDTAGILVKKIKPNFKTLGPRFGKLMKTVADAVNGFTQSDISAIERDGKYSITLENQSMEISLEDVEISSEDIPGWLVANQGIHTVALDVTLTDELKQEGIARELVNRIQNLRKESGFEVTDKINIRIGEILSVNEAVNKFGHYIRTQTLAERIDLLPTLHGENAILIEIDEETQTSLSISKI